MQVIGHAFFLAVVNYTLQLVGEQWAGLEPLPAEC